MDHKQLMDDVIPNLTLKNVETIINAFASHMEICMGVLGRMGLSDQLSHAYLSGSWFYLHGDNSDADRDLWNDDESLRKEIKAHILKTYFKRDVPWERVDQHFDDLMELLAKELEG